MAFDEVLAQVLVLLQRESRLSYRDLRTLFNLDDDDLEGLRAEIIEAKQLAIDENHEELVWTGGPAEAGARTGDRNRQQLTVLFCDLVGSTALSGTLDPEDFRAVMRDYQQVSAAVIDRFDGHIAQYLGDGLLVYFGYPQAHEDDVQRAVRAGLGIVEAMAALNHRLAAQYGVRLAVRIGIHTGLVVVGELGGGERQEQLALGETPNVAAGIQELAPADSVVLSATTARLIADAFVCEELGTHVVTGVAAPIQVSRVLPSSETQRQPDVAEPSGPADDRPDDAERRQLTVMFCDWAGAATLTTQLAPEALLAVVRAYQQASAAVIGRFDGHIAQYLDHGLLVYFGYPQAHEDDAQRAVRAGLGIVDTMVTLNDSLAAQHGIRVAVRIGIHTGLVVAGEMGGGSRTEQMVVGETLNVASRIQGLAAPDTVVISAATTRLLASDFVCENLGTHKLRGVAVPMQVTRVLGESEVQNRLDGAGTTGSLDLVGRESEVSLLLDRWAQSKAGQGQVVVLSGEAGIGKSRLVEALREQVGQEGALCVVVRCSPYHTNSTFYPVTTQLGRLCQFRREDTPTDKWDKLERVLATYRFPQPETLPLLAALLSIPLPAHVPPLNLSPAQQKLKTQDALLAWAVENADRHPTLAVWEDLHWVDPSTLELLDLLINRVPTMRMLVLLACRPEFQSPWESRDYVTQLTLNRLGHVQVEAIVASVTGGKSLPAALLEQIVAKTDGVPLFVEEITKTILESGMLRDVDGRYELTGPVAAVTIPMTLQDSLMARLDRLGPAKGLAQLGAVVGRESPYELIQAVWNGDEETLQSWLRQLVDMELLHRRGPQPPVFYTFKHALIQDTAYQSLIRSTRQRYHQQIAQALEEQFPDIVEAQPELLAHHYTEAGLRERAIEYWLQAGRLAIQRSAHVEAIGHLTKGLEVLRTLPDTPEHVQSELALHLAMGSPLIATKGYAAPEVGDTYARARQLSQHVQEIPRRLQVLMGLWMFYAVRAELHTAQELAEQLLSLSQSQPDPALFLEAQQALGITFSMRGVLAPARAHFERGIALYDPQQHHAHAFLYGQDSKVVCLCHVAIVLWLLGYPDQALARCAEALSVAQALSHPLSLSWALFYAAMVHQLRREVPATQERAEALIALCREQGFAYRLVQGNILRGWALAEQGQGEAEIAQIQQSLEAVRATGAGVYRPYFLALLAEVYGKVGQPEAALTGLNETVTVVDATDERFYEAELYRLKGELLLKRGAANDVEAVSCFRHALEVARRQQAKSLELRTAISLSRLWQRQGQNAKARQLLTELNGWFTEGWDTPDLREAQTLLTQLV